MTSIDLTRADETIDLGRSVLDLLGEGCSGEQVRSALSITADEAEKALAAYAARVLHGTTPPMPSAECGLGGYDGWCYTHGLYHAAVSS